MNFQFKHLHLFQYRKFYLGSLSIQYINPLILNNQVILTRVCNTCKFYSNNFHTFFSPQPNLSLCYHFATWTLSCVLVCICLFSSLCLSTASSLRVLLLLLPMMLCNSQQSVYLTPARFITLQVRFNVHVNTALVLNTFNSMITTSPHIHKAVSSKTY